MNRAMKELPNIIFPNIDEDMYAKMCHTVGFDRKTDNRRYFYPYRNYYDCAECDLQSFSKMVEQELAEKKDNGFYSLTLLGLNALSIISGVRVFNPCAKYDTDLKNYVVRILCQNDVYCGHGCWFPTSVKSLCNFHRLPTHRVRKIMHELVADGYAVKSHYGEYNEDYGVGCIHGYYLTEKAHEWDTWKRAYKENADYLNRLLNDNFELGK